MTLNTEAFAKALAAGIAAYEAASNMSDGWIEWRGGVNPECGNVVEIRMRSGEVDTNIASNLSWEHMPSDETEDIVAYRRSR